MRDLTEPALREKLSVPQTELVELVFSLDRRGGAEASDLAAMIAARLGEIAATADEVVVTRAPGRPDSVRSSLGST